MKESVYCLIELFTTYNEYGDRHSLGFIGKRSDGMFCADYSRWTAYKFTEDEASKYAKRLVPQYTVKVYHYGVKPSKPTKPAIEHINMR